MKEKNDDFFRSLEKGLQECLQWARGELELRTIERIMPPPAVKAIDVVQLRRKLKMSQGVFAQVINVSTKTIQSWEQGERKPSQASLRLLQIIAENPEYVTGLPCHTNGKSKSSGRTSKTRT